MKRYKNIQFIIFIVISALIICGFIYIKHEKAVSLNKKPESNTDKTSVTSNPTIASNDSTTATKTTQKANLENLSMPILMYHHIRDFINPNDKIGTNLSVAPSKLAEQLDYIKSKGYETITFEDLTVNKIPAKPVILTFDDGYKNFYQNAFPELKKRNMKAVVFIITGDIGGGEYMTSSELKEISQYGIEIGDHTISHPDLTKISVDKAQKEIANSKSALETLTGKKVISFCYPSGKFNPEVENVVKNAGYIYATTTVGGITSFNNLFELNRYRVNKDTDATKYIR